ncbi:MAG: hypothetical protein M3173_01485 [Chloroflexota bacterium]|nr:hypothetical protein [Chloroflexota bacterium]
MAEKVIKQHLGRHRCEQHRSPVIAVAIEGEFGLSRSFGVAVEGATFCDDAYETPRALRAGWR